MCMDSQGENSIHNLPHITDFRLECCILKEDTKNNISGRNIWAGGWSESKPHLLNSYLTNLTTPPGRAPLFIFLRSVFLVLKMLL